MEILMSAAISVPVKAALVNWLPWSVLKDFWFAEASQRFLQCRHAERHVHRIRQPPRQPARLAQSMTATR